MSNNDLISREHLRDAFDNLCCHNCKTCRNFKKEGCSFYRCDLIDNAPPVNDCPNCEYKLEADYIRSSSSYKELIDLRKFKETNTRPQGEWKSLGFAPSRGYAWCTCSNCGKTTKIYLDKDNDFCCIADIRNKAVACLFCGADMRKGGAE